MPMEIARKIRERAEEAAKDHDLSEKISRASLKAIFAGIGKFDHNGVITEPTTEWKDLMSIYTKDADELKRLCGQEAFFNRSDWGLACLAYIAGDSACTTDTNMTGGSLRSMMLHEEKRHMIRNLDAKEGDLEEFKEGSVFTRITANDE